MPYDEQVAAAQDVLHQAHARSSRSVRRHVALLLGTLAIVVVPNVWMLVANVLQ